MEVSEAFLSVAQMMTGRVFVMISGLNASSASGPTRKKNTHNLFDASKNLMLSRQFIATFPAGWSPQKVVKSKGIRSPKWPKDSS